MASVCPLVTLSPSDTLTSTTWPLENGNTFTTLLSSLETWPDRVNSSFIDVVLAVSMVIILDNESLMHTCLLSGTSCFFWVHAAKSIIMERLINNASLFFVIIFILSGMFIYSGLYYSCTHSIIQIGN